MAPATARGDVALVGRRALAQDADGRRRRRHGKIGENAPWLQNIIITAAAGSTDRRAGRPPRADGPERGRACSRAATEVARKTQRNDGQAWHSAGGETERERDHAPLDIVGKKKFPPPAASPPPLRPSSPLLPSVRYHSVLSFGVGVGRGRHRKRRRSRLICPNGLCLRPREQDHKNSETAQEGERERERVIDLNRSQEVRNLQLTTRGALCLPAQCSSGRRAVLFGDRVTAIDMYVSDVTERPVSAILAEIHKRVIIHELNCTDMNEGREDVSEGIMKKATKRVRCGRGSRSH